MRRRELLGLGVSTAIVLLVGCSKDGKKRGGKGGDDASLPPIQFSVDTPDLMLTWIDDRGGTHVESKVERVPTEQARLVRVSGGEAKDSSVEIYVADISEPAKEYTAHGYARSAWEEEIARRRKDNPDVEESPRQRPREARAPRRTDGNPSNDPHGRPDSDRESPPDKLDPSMKGVTVIVYGASWCSACHAALDHLRGKGVKTVFKNIETDRSASEEMSVKLERAGGRRGSIPVIDIAGQIIVGFSARDIDRALKKAVASPKGASGTLM